MNLTADEIFGPEEQHERRVQIALDSERAKREARRRLAAEDRADVPLPIIETLRDRLARPRQPILYRIEGWQPQGTRVVQAAQFKSGKTTLKANLTRSLIDGDPFLGRYPVTPITGTVVDVDLEMSENQLTGWWAAQAIRGDDRVIPISLRGRASSFNILDPDVRAEWARLFRRVGCEYLAVDCLRPILDALSLDEQGEAGRFLVALDALMEAAGIPECMVVHHMGHSGERSRGDSRLRDWPDVEWRLVRQDDDPASARFISAYGRDVDIPESQLTYDTETRRLTIGGGSRADSAALGALDDVWNLLRDASEPLTGRAIKKEMENSEHPRAAIEKALRLGTQQGKLAKRTGPRNAQLYSSVPVSRSVPPVSQDSQSECPSIYRTGTLEHSTPRLVSVPVGTDGKPFVFDPTGALGAKP